MCVKAGSNFEPSEESRYAQADTRALRHKADRLVTGSLKLCSVVVRQKFVYASAASPCVR